MQPTDPLCRQKAKDTLYQEFTEGDDFVTINLEVNGNNANTGRSKDGMFVETEMLRLSWLP